MRTWVFLDDHLGFVHRMIDREIDLTEWTGGGEGPVTILVRFALEPDELTVPLEAG